MGLFRSVWSKLAAKLSVAAQTPDQLLRDPCNGSAQSTSASTLTTSRDTIVMSTSHRDTGSAESFVEPSRGNVSWHTLLSSPSTNSDTFTVGIASCEPRTGSLALHRHKQAEIYYITAGGGTVRIENKSLQVKSGDVVYIPGDMEHGVFNKGDEELKWLYCFATDGFGDVVYRFTGENNNTKDSGLIGNFS